MTPQTNTIARSTAATYPAEPCHHDLHDELFYQRYALDRHAIVSTADLFGSITSVNDNFCRISGYSRDELMGRNHSILRSGLHPSGFFQAMYDTLACGAIWQGEICNRAKDGSLYWVSATMLMYGDSSGLPTRYLSIRTDITLRKTNELELRNYSSQLEEMVKTKTAELQRATTVANAANLAKSEFLAHMSHEVRTPMNGVIGMVDVLQQTELSPDQRRMVDTIANSSQALLRVLKDIPSVAQAAASGRLILVAEDDEVNREVIQEQLRLLGYAAEVAEDGLEALGKWRTGRYALLLTDCQMPHMDGFALTAAIRAAQAPGTVPPIIIAITANAMQGEAQRCMDGGMDDFMTKPLRLKELGAMLAKWLPSPQSHCHLAL
jgi:PAS domain S-box-containing protein